MSGRPDENLCSNSELNSIKTSSGGAAAESRGDRETPARATPAAAPRARRPVTLIDGEPAGSGLTSARELLREIGMMFSPVDAAGRVLATQVIRPNDPAALVRAEQLLAVPLEGLDEDAARSARSERLAYVLDVCRRFADLCRRDKAKARWWGPVMLEQAAPAGKTLSRWAMLERDVAEAERAAGEAEARAREAAQAYAAVRAPAPATAADVARADKALEEFRALVGGLGAALRPGAPRVVGGRAVTLSERDEEAEIERRRQEIGVLAEARRIAGRELTTDEANKIRERLKRERQREEGART